MGGQNISCEVSKSQSPIDIIDSIYSPSLHSVRFRYVESVLHLTNIGSLPLAVPTEGNHIVFEGVTYQLTKIGLHSPSEHKLQGASFDMEIQLYHQSSTGAKLNIAIFVNEGAGHLNLSRVIDAIPKLAGDEQHLAGIDLRTLVPKNNSYYLYPGSDTMPPCEEGVRWIIMKNAITASPLVFNKFQHQFGHNNRSSQGLFARIIVHN